MTNNIVFWSKDQQYGLRLPKEQFDAMRLLCIAAGRKETGGILIGEYTKARDCALVTLATPPPSDSVHQPTRFFRGVTGLEKLLRSIWIKENRHYIGEWHYHPYSASHYSNVDENQLSQISASPNYKCLAPILLIIGGSEETGWEVSAYVSPQNDSLTELILKSTFTSITKIASRFPHQ